MMTKKSSKRHVALGYTRSAFAGDSSKIAEQRANIEAYCLRKGWIPEWYSDEGKRGMSDMEKTEWAKLEKRLSDPDVVAVVANDLSRILRKMWRVGKLMETLDGLGVHLALAAPGREIDTSTSTGRMMITIIAMQDEGYANNFLIRAKESIAYRRSRGITFGIPPLGTIRNEQGYLVPSLEGAWLLCDGRHAPGKAGDPVPEEGAIWRGYYDCAKRILALSNEEKSMVGIAHKLAEEGWAFRNRYHVPRPITRGDVRRVIAHKQLYDQLPAA